MTKRKSQLRAEFRRLMFKVHSDLAAAGKEIDRLGAIGDLIRGGDVCDMYACYASNSLHGTRALLREMCAAVGKATP